MKSSAKYFVLMVCLLGPGMARAQSVGKVECPRGDGYVYLYSSMTTLDVRATLQCGEQVQITGHYDTYFGVRTSKGDTGYLPISAVLLYKDSAGPKSPAPPKPAARPRVAYDEPAPKPEPSPKAMPSATEFILLNGTAIHMTLGKSISSATAHVGDVVELRVAEELVVEGLSVIPAGAVATGIVTDAEPKKHLGRGGKLGLTINFVRLNDDEKAAVRSFQEGSGSSNSAGTVLPLASGKDVIFAQGMEFTAYVDGDIHLKRDAFQPAKDGADSTPAVPAQKPSQPRGL